MLFAYFGPESFVPLSSGIAAIVGTGLVFGRASVSMILKPLQLLGRGHRRARSPIPPRSRSAPAPHIQGLQK